ncbi:PREDICTED: far upstream element-binding protein 3 isoform X4 [Ceratosolen solmsi marchali]|uniref:Far upstream element-binding protein 3 isoform X4 n=1 Tax=Ceratosolen solmsi marchali TaxID=326594 RepID=A0AAJ6YN18_9HYME|nr:PREDICTED: far upstream element-binding protein 3 isoform X4 [Ceratosolen solmsi marchali]
MMSDYSAVAPPQDFSQSSAFAAALQRAKQIAAKINPQGVTNNQDPQKKRPLEDCPEPEPKKLTPIITDPLINLRGNTTPGIPTNINDSPISRPSGPTTPNPVALGGICNEDIRVPDKMVGLIIGRGGEQITRLQSETGCKIQMAAESGGLPERTCTLTGSREAVNRAKELVLSIVNQRNKPGDDQIPGTNPPYPGPSSSTPQSMMSGHPGFVEIMIPGPKVGLIIGKGGETIKQLQEKSGAKMVVIQEGPAQEQEKPLRITGDQQKVEHAKQLVYELIAEKEMQMYSRGTRNSSGHNFSGNNSFNQDGSADGVEVFVPKAAVGVVIGKGGDMIKKLQQETGAKIQFIQMKDEGPGDRNCIINGKDDCVENARQRIQDMIDSVVKGRGNPRGNGFNSGRPNEYGGWDGNRRQNDIGNKIEFSYPVPSNKCGIIIGKGGETIKQINQQTGAHCELDRRNPGTETEKFFTIRGTPEQVEHAKRIFGEKLGGGGMTSTNSIYGGQNTMGYNPSWNATPGYQAWPGQTPTGDPNAANQASVQINPATGQPDYSAQWAEYYRSMGMHREAEIIEQQTKQQQQQQATGVKPDMNQQSGGGQAPGNPTAPTGPQQAQQQPQPQQQQQQQQQQGAQQNGGQADYSAQWAEYYRSIGKIKEAEAIEAQMKTGKQGGGMQNNQMSQPQQQQQQPQMQPNTMASQGGAPGGGGGPGTAPNAFPQPYGGYPGMNPASAGGYYTPGAQSSGQPGQQNPTFPTATGYQNYQYPQPSSDN